MGTQLRHMSLSPPESNLTFLSLIPISNSGISSCDDVFAVVVLAYLVHIFLSSIRSATYSLDYRVDSFQ